MTSEPRASGRAAGRPRRAAPAAARAPARAPSSPTTTTKTRGEGWTDVTGDEEKAPPPPLPGIPPAPRRARRRLRSRPRPPWRRLRTTTTGRRAARRTRSRPNLPRTRRGEKIPPQPPPPRTPRPPPPRPPPVPPDPPPPPRTPRPRRRYRRRFLRTRRPRRFRHRLFRLFRLFRFPRRSGIEPPTFRRRASTSRAAAERGIQPVKSPVFSVAFWRAVGAALGIDSSGNPLRAPTASTRTNASAAFEVASTRVAVRIPKPFVRSRETRRWGRPRVGGGALARPSRRVFPSTRTENFFCSNKTEPRYYAADYACACDCAGCDCRRYYACWDCGLDARTGTRRCLSQASYLCARGHFSFFNEKRQACAWEQPRPLQFGCPPRPPRTRPCPSRPCLRAARTRPPPPPTRPIPGSAAGAAGCGAPRVRFQAEASRSRGADPSPLANNPGLSPGLYPGVAPAAGRGRCAARVGVAVTASSPPPGVAAPGVGAPGVGPGRTTHRASARRVSAPLRRADAARLVLEHPDVRLVPPVRHRATFVCCCDAACAAWNPATQQGQVAGVLRTRADYAQVCARPAGR